jgi:putative peptidoglycan lipid II flippase
MVGILGIFVTLSILAMPYIVTLIAPGFEAGSARFDAAVSYARITFPYLLLMSITAMFGAMLNANNRFAPFAMAPIIFNLTLITAMVFANHHGYEISKALSIGITVSGVLQLVFMGWMTFKARIQPHFSRYEHSGEVKKVFSLMGPGVLGAGVMHVNLFADMIIASFLPVGAISALYYADRLNQLPLGVVGIAMGTALLPMLSVALAKKKSADAQKLFSQALEACVFLALPSALGLSVLSELIISVLFERGAFGAESTLRASYALMGYTVGLVPYVASKVLSTVFWAHKDTWTPVKISMQVTALNIVLSIILIFPFNEAGIALSTGLVGWLQFFMLKKKMRGYGDITIAVDAKRRITKLIIAAFIMMAVICAASLIWNNVMGAERAGFIKMLTLIGCGVISYGATVFMLRIYNLRAIKHFFVKQ